MSCSWEFFQFYCLHDADLDSQEFWYYFMLSYALLTSFFLEGAHKEE